MCICPVYFSDVIWCFSKNGVQVMEAGDQSSICSGTDITVDYRINPLVGHAGAAAENSERCCRIRECPDPRLLLPARCTQK